MAKVNLESLTVPNGASESNVVGGRILNNIKSLTIMAPSPLTGTFSVEVSDKYPDVVQSTDWYALESGGTPIVLTAGEATVILAVPFLSIRITASAGPTGDKEFKVTGDDEIPGNLWS